MGTDRSGTAIDSSLDALIAAALDEDIGEADFTTQWTVDARQRGHAVVVAREGGVVAGVDVARLAFGHLDPAIQVRPQRVDGDRVSAGDTVLSVEGGLRSILTAERVALNFLAHLSGVATLTAAFVDAVAGTRCRITDTRKTTPGLRHFEKAAVRAGGGVSHRARLDAMVLIKENHIRAAGGVVKALEAVRDPARDRGLTVEIEVTSIRELEEALACRPDRVMLDNLTLDELREAVRAARARVGGEVVLEASGGVRLDTVLQIADTGVDEVSVGALTHSAPALDLSLLVESA